MYIARRAGWARGTRRATASPSKTAALLETLFATTALAALALSVTMAQTSDDPNTDAASRTSTPPAAIAPHGGEMMFAGYTGVPYTYPSDVSVTQSGVHDFTAKSVEWEGRPFKNPIYYGARIVRWFESGRTGAMIDFIHSKTIGRLSEEVELTGTFNGAPAPERAVLRDIFERVEASHGHNMLTLTGLLRLPSLGFRLHPYVGFGAGVSLPHAEVHVAGRETRTYEYQVAGPVTQALIGIEIRAARVSYLFEYKFTLAPYRMPLTERDGTLLIFDLWNQLREWMSGEEPPGGYASTNLVSHQGIAGIGIRSAPPAAVAP